MWLFREHRLWTRLSASWSSSFLVLVNMRLSLVIEGTSLSRRPEALMWSCFPSSHISPMIMAFSAISSLTRSTISDLLAFSACSKIISRTLEAGSVAQQSEMYSRASISSSVGPHDTCTSAISSSSRLAGSQYTIDSILYLALKSKKEESVSSHCLSSLPSVRRLWGSLASYAPLCKKACRF